jgi:isochorismate pyruvate lyase
MMQAEQRALLAPHRAEIDRIDGAIAALLGERFAVVRQVAALKAQHGIAPILPDRIEEVVAQARANAAAASFDPDLAEQIYRLLIDAACRLEENFARDQGPQDQGHRAT